MAIFGIYVKFLVGLSPKNLWLKEISPTSRAKTLMIRQRIVENTSCNFRSKMNSLVSDKEN